MSQREIFFFQLDPTNIYFYLPPPSSLLQYGALQGLCKAETAAQVELALHCEKKKLRGDGDCVPGSHEDAPRSGQLLGYAFCGSSQEIEEDDGAVFLSFGSNEAWIHERFNLREACSAYKLYTMHVDVAARTKASTDEVEDRWKQTFTLMARAAFVVGVLVEAGCIKEKDRPQWFLWSDYGSSYQ